MLSTVTFQPDEKKEKITRIIGLSNFNKEILYNYQRPYLLQKLVQNFNIDNQGMYEMSKLPVSDLEYLVDRNPLLLQFMLQLQKDAGLKNPFDSFKYVVRNREKD
jgi:hypothetical protein